MEDEELLRLFSQESSKHYAFNSLVRKYQQKVYMLARKMVIDHDDADDITQDVFVKVWHNLADFKANSKLYTWIYRITANECLTLLRKKRRRFMIPIVDVVAQLEAKLDSGSYISGDEIQIKLQKAILKLPEKQRLVFNMRYFDELPYEDIATITDTSVGALKASYHFAVKKIETQLKATL